MDERKFTEEPIHEEIDMEDDPEAESDDMIVS